MNAKAPRWLRRGTRLLVIFAALTVVFVASVTLVFLLPRGPIKRHLAESIPQLEAEGTAYRPFFDIPSYQLDGFTDPLMLNVALGRPGESALRAGLEDVFALPPNTSASQLSGSWATLPQLKAGLADQYSNAFPYARYWHGYLLLLRPALVVLTYPAIRFVNMFLFAAAALGTALLLARRFGGRLAFAFVLALLWVSALIIPMSLQFTSVFMLAMLASIVVLAFGDKSWFRRWDLEVFLVIGMLTAFFDLFTAPLVTLGLPLLMLLLVLESVHEEYGMRSGVVETVKLGAVWSVGYAFSWASKWFIGSAVLGWSVLTNALSDFKFWTTTSAPIFQGSVASARAHSLGPLGANLAMLVPLFGLGDNLAGLQTETVVATVALAFAVVAVVLVLALRFHKPWARWTRQVPLLAVAALPYIWYALWHTPSTQHFWFNYRSQVITLFAILAFLLLNTDYDAITSRIHAWSWVRRLLERDAIA